MGVQDASEKKNECKQKNKIKAYINIEFKEFTEAKLKICLQKFEKELKTLKIETAQRESQLVRMVRRSAVLCQARERPV